MKYLHDVLDYALVGGILFASVLYATYALGPRAFRPRLLSTAAALLARMPGVFGLRSAARRLEAAAAVKSAMACGGCGTCASNAAAPAESNEVSVPIATISKRRGG